MYSNKLYFDNVINEVIEAEFIDSYKLNKTDNKNIYKLTLTNKADISDFHYIKINGEKFITNKTRNMIIAFAFLFNLKASADDRIKYDSDKTFSITLTQNNIKSNIDFVFDFSRWKVFIKKINICFGKCTTIIKYDNGNRKRYDVNLRGMVELKTKFSSIMYDVTKATIMNDIKSKM